MSVDGKKLRAYIYQYEAHEDARAAALDDQRQLLKDAEEIDGINAKVLRRLIKELKKPRAEVAAEDALLQEYRDAYLSFESTPLGQSASVSLGSVTLTPDDIPSLAAPKASVPETADDIPPLSAADEAALVADWAARKVKAKVTRIFAEAEKPEIVPPHGTPKHYGVRQPD